ncbi:MAG: heat-inducible transcription repressor HrcA [candidate division Zixibacteria bacterium]|nr:heat-inducible transcription repressor HrcA [candidate division Zixibacteria bacterium]
MGFENLNNRETKILKALIDHYINTAEPVASRTLSKKYNIGLSPASIRNTMKDLEEKGFIDQPHTSAGRVPTNLGYHIYVDYLLTPEKLTDDEKEIILKEMTSEFTEVAYILDQTSKMLGALSKQLGVTVTTKFDSAILTRLELIPVAEQKMMVVLVVKSGLVKSILFEVESSLPHMAINETARVLNERLCGLSLGDIKRTIHERIKDTGAGDPKLIKLFVEGPDEIWDFPTDDNLHYSGTSNLFQQPEFQNPQNMAEVVEMIEDRKIIHEMLVNTGISEGITVSIGHKNKKGKTDQLSLLTSSYDMGGVKGIVGVIGPKRMKYSKLVSLVDYTAKMLSKVMSE